MKTQQYKLICLLLVLSMMMGIMLGCAGKEPSTSQNPSIPSTTIAPSTATPTESEATAPTDPPTEPTIPPTEPPAPTEPTPEPPSVNAKYSFIYDTRTGSFLYSSADIYTSLYPASVTKLFTAYVALQFLDPDESVTVGKELSLVAEDASTAGLEKGQTWTVEGLLYCALLPSGCDASYTLAVAAGRKILLNPDASVQDALKAFMVQCNFLAWELGMENTNFITPDGYHRKNHYISMMAYPIIAQCILEDEVLSAIVKCSSTTVTYKNAAGRKCSTKMWNTNKLVNSAATEFYRSEAVGLKTGSTTPAGYCLLSAFQVEGGYIVIGVFGCSVKEHRFTETNKLFDYYLELQ